MFSVVLKYVHSFHASFFTVFVKHYKIITTCSENLVNDDEANQLSDAESAPQQFVWNLREKLDRDSFLFDVPCLLETLSKIRGER